VLVVKVFATWQIEEANFVGQQCLSPHILIPYKQVNERVNSQIFVKWLRIRRPFILDRLVKNHVKITGLPGTKEEALGQECHGHGL
jgi:hypothetical protein